MYRAAANNWWTEDETGLKMDLNEYCTISTVYNGNKIFLYKNGELINTLEEQTPSNSINQIYLMWSKTNSRRELIGNLKSFRLYNRALSSEEISYNYNIDKHREYA